MERILGADFIKTSGEMGAEFIKKSEAAFAQAPAN